MLRKRHWIPLGFGIASAALAAPVLAADAYTGHVFVPNRDSADVAVIDPLRDEVVARIQVGEVPHQVAISDRLQRLVATNTADDTISIVDLADGQERVRIPLGHEPEHMELSPDGELLAVGNIGAGSVSLVSLGEERELARIDGLHQPHNMTFGPDGERLFVGNLGAPLVSVIDVASRRVIDEIPVGEPGLSAGALDDGSFQGVISVTPTPDRRLGFAAYGEGDRIAVLDLESGQTITSIPLGDEPWRAYTTADGRFMLVPNNGDRTVSIIATSNLEEVARLPGAADMTGVNTGWFETTAFVLSRGESKVLIYDLERLEPAGEILLPGAPETGVVTPDGAKLYVALGSTGQVAVIDTRARELARVIDDVGGTPWGAHMVGALNYCH